MKKTLIILALVAMIVLPIAAKQQIGLELGMVTGVNYRNTLKDNQVLTASAGIYNFGDIEVAGGLLWDRPAVSIGKADFHHLFGAQADVSLHLGEGTGVAISVQGVAEIDYDFKWLNDLTFSAFFRVAYGPSIVFNGDGVAFDFLHYSASLGLIHEF